MLNNILFAIWFLLPAGLGNASPIFASVIPFLKELNQPIDGGRKFRGKELFGSHKTWRGLISGIIVATLVFALQQYLVRHHAWAQTVVKGTDYASLPFILGPLLGLGALGGDAVESFFKRQNNVKSGQAWMPFDQLDYIIGALVVTLLFIRLRLVEYVWIFIIWFGMHIVFSYLGWMAKLKDSPI